MPPHPASTVRNTAEGSTPPIPGAALPRVMAAIILSAIFCFVHLALSQRLPQPWPLWPAAAVALAFAWRYGPLWTIPAALGALPVAVLQAAAPLDLAALLLGVVIGPAVAVFLLERQERWHPAQSATQASLRFMGITTLVAAPATMLSSVLLGRVATVGLPVSRLSEFPIGMPALGMWVAGMMTLLLVTPALLALFDLRPQGASQSRSDSARWFDVPCVSISFAFGLLIIMLGLSGQQTLARIALFAVFPIMMWSALRNEARSHALTLLFVSLPSFGAAYHGIRQHADSTVALLGMGAALCMLMVCALGCAIIAQALVADRQQALDASVRLGREDADTGLLNDRGFTDEMQSVLSQPARPALGLIALQIGNLQALRDLCGPIEAARIEAHIAATMRQLVDEGGPQTGRIASRWTGDRYLLMEPSNGVAELRALGRQLYSRLDGESGTGPHDRVSLRISVGGILVETGALVQPDECLAALEDAIAIAASVHDPQLFVEPLSASMLEARRAQHDRIEQLREAIRDERIEIHAQPVIDPDAPPGMLAYEVLTRLRDRDGALIQPPEFMPLAVKAQLLAKLDRAVIHRVFEWLATHPEALARTWRCAINLSGASLDDPGLPEFVRSTRAEHDLDASKIVFEITESSAIRHAAAASRLVDELKSDGFGIALDDFGTGLATFEYLKRFPLDYLKIDGSFIRNLMEDTLDEEIVLSTLRVANKLKLRAVAEHVHSEEVHQRLRGLGVRYLQGDLFGRAAPIESLFDPASSATSSLPTDREQHQRTGAIAPLPGTDLKRASL